MIVTSSDTYLRAVFCCSFKYAPYSSVVNNLINVATFLTQMCGCLLNGHPLHF